MENVTLEWCMERAHKWLENIIIAKDGDRVIGFVGYGPNCDHRLAEKGEIYSLYVLGEYQGQSIGYELMNAALKMIPDFDKIAVWVLKNNDRAIRFYERYGFRSDGVEMEAMMGASNRGQRMVYDKHRASA